MEYRSGTIGKEIRSDGIRLRTESFPAKEKQLVETGCFFIFKQGGEYNKEKPYER